MKVRANWRFRIGRLVYEKGEKKKGGFEDWGEVVFCLLDWGWFLWGVFKKK